MTPLNVIDANRGGVVTTPSPRLARVLVGVNGGAASASAVSAAVDLVAPDGTLHLARIVSTSLVRRFSDWLRSGGLTEAARTHREVLAEQSLAEVAAAVRRATPAEVELLVSRGDVARELLRLSADRGAELLVIGDARPRRLLGGVADRLARHAQLTLVVPEGTDLRRARRALVLAAGPSPGQELARARAALESLALRYDFRSLRSGLDRDLRRELRSAAPTTVLLVPQRTVESEPGTRWLLDHTSCPVLFVPRAQASARAPIDTVAEYAAWHGDVALFRRALPPAHHIERRDT